MRGCSAVVAGALLCLAIGIASGQPPEPAPPPSATPAAAGEVIGDVLEQASQTTTTPAPVEYEWLRKPGPDTVICPFRGRIDYDDGEIECGLIQVPENREVPDSRTIELHYVRILATGKDKDGKDVEKRTDPVMYLTGGPGVGVDYYVKKLKDHGIVGQRDLYILEQRGIGSSTSFCPFYETRNRRAQIHDNYAAQLRNMITQAQACIEGASSQGIDMRGYNTFENARDVRALRQALGFGKWNVWGISYGSVLGQALVKVDPDGIKALAIDGIVPLDIADLMRVASWYQRDLDKLAAACQKQSACADAYPDQTRRYLSAIQAVLDQPFALTVKPGEFYPDGKAYVFADYVAGIPFSLLYDHPTHPAIPAIIEGLIRAVETRDERLFKALALSTSLGQVDGTYGAGMSLAIRCQDGYAEQFQRVVGEENARHPALAAALLGTPEFAAGMVAGCAAGGLPARDIAAYAPLVSDLPILVTNGAWDPVTPTPLAEYIMPGLSNARLVEFPNVGHGATRAQKCGGDFLNRFFDDPAAPVDMDCVNDGQKPATYVAPYFATSAIAQATVQLAEDKKKLIPHGVWVGVSFALAATGLLALVLGWFARRIDREQRRSGAAVRVFAGLAALAATGYVLGLAAAGAISFKMAPVLLLFGLVGWAWWVAWLGPIAGIFGIFALLLALFAGTATRAARLGLAMVAMAAISVSVFGWVWDLWPF